MIILLIVVIIAIIYILAIYNIIIKQLNSVKHAKSSIDVYLTQRFECLIIKIKAKLTIIKIKNILINAITALIYAPLSFLIKLSASIARCFLSSSFLFSKMISAFAMLIRALA